MPGEPTLLQIERRESMREDYLRRERELSETSHCLRMFPGNEFLMAAKQASVDKLVKSLLDYTNRWGEIPKHEAEVKVVD